MWHHKYTYAKGIYRKDDPNHWYSFYTPLSNPPESEKLVGGLYNTGGSYQDQLWAL